jgi:hypothetical protein
MLMAATSGKATEVRKVSNRTNSGAEDVDFRGGLIVITNKAPDNGALSKAILDRMTHYEYNPTDEELIALMHERVRKASKDGLTIGERRET